MINNSGGYVLTVADCSVEYTTSCFWVTAMKQQLKLTSGGVLGGSVELSLPPLISFSLSLHSLIGPFCSKFPQSFSNWQQSVISNNRAVSSNAPTFFFSEHQAPECCFYTPLVNEHKFAVNGVAGDVFSGLDANVSVHWLGHNVRVQPANGYQATQVAAFIVGLVVVVQAHLGGRPALQIARAVDGAEALAVS